VPQAHVRRGITVLLALIFSKYFYLASMVGYFTFYLISRFHISVRSSQLHLFVFLGAAAAGTFFGGPIGDRIGPRYVIWGSILGVLPFTLLLPHANLFWTGILSAIIGFVIASAFSAIVVYAQELIPGKRVVFTWKWDDDEAWENYDSVVSVDFSDRDGGTELRLTHVQLPSEASRDRHNEGWNSVIDRLEKFVNE